MTKQLIVLAVLKNGTGLAVSSKLGTGKLNSFHPADRRIQWAWTNKSIVAQAAKELAISPKSIKCVIEVYAPAINADGVKLKDQQPEQALPAGLTITPEKDDEGRQVFAWRCGEHGGYSAAENRWCYFIPPQEPNDRGFIPALVIEGQQGYHMMSGNGEGSEPWYWGKTEDEANRVCDSQNTRHGISKADQQAIVLSSMPGNFTPA